MSRPGFLSRIYPRLGTLIAVIGAFDIVMTTVLLLLNSGSPPGSNWQAFLEIQITKFKYRYAVSDVWILSLFRAGPAALVLWGVGKKAREATGPSRKKLVRTCVFMCFKTCLSFLALLGKASQFFQSFDNAPEKIRNNAKYSDDTLLFALVLAGVEAVLCALVLIGVTYDPRLGGRGNHSGVGIKVGDDEDGGDLRVGLLEAGGEVKEEVLDARDGGGNSGSNGGGSDGSTEQDEQGDDGRKKHKDGKKDMRASVGRLLSLSRPERGMIVIGTIALLLSTVSTMALPYFIGQLIDDVQTTQDKQAARHRLDTSTLELLAILLVGSVFTFVRGVLFNVAGERLVARIRRRLFEAVMRQDVAFFDQSKTGELMNRLSADTTVIQNACTSNVSMFLRFTLQVIMSIILLIYTSWKLSLVMLAVVPALVISTRIYGAFTRKYSKRYQDALASSSDAAQEAISNLRTVRSFAAEDKEVERYGSRVNESYRLGVKKAVAYGLFVGGLGALAYMAMLLVLWYGGKLVLSGSMSPGTLTSFLLYTLYIATGLSVLSGLVSEWFTAVGASERMFELLDAVPSIPLHGGTPPSTEGINGRVVFNQVLFSYPSRNDVVVLRDLSLTVQPNAAVALVGHSGAGKSTVLALLQRFYDVTSGSITIDGRDLRDWDMSCLRRHMAVVSQEPCLFGATIRENIAYGVTAHGAPMPSNDQLISVCKLANCHDFISKFPDGYDTMVGERGVRLSGGQKQRVAIARALFVNPKILLLDEATSALDAESEHLVQQAIDRLMVGRTVIVIAHRLSTVRHAACIVVMGEGGVIRGMGTHDELLRTSEAYRQLIKRQLQQQTQDYDVSVYENGEEGGSGGSEGGAGGEEGGKGVGGVSGSDGGDGPGLQGGDGVRMTGQGTTDVIGAQLQAPTRVVESINGV